MTSSVAIAGAAAMLLVSAPASAAPIVYSSEASFAAAVGNSITDDYSNSGYVDGGGSKGLHLMTDSFMSSVLGEARYTDTEFSNSNQVVAPVSPTISYFCSGPGCNGSFDLGFQDTTLTTDGGVYGVSFNYRDGVPNSTGQLIDFLVTFADGTTTDYTVPRSGAFLPSGFATDFFGITSDEQIADIYFGVDGAPSSSTVFGLDNLTIAASATPVPEPMSVAIFVTGLAGLTAMTLRKRAQKA